jgi:hypothetical protein
MDTKEPGGESKLQAMSLPKDSSVDACEAARWTFVSLMASLSQIDRLSYSVYAVDGAALKTLSLWERAGRGCIVFR